jgi:hypothetical protein
MRPGRTIPRRPLLRALQIAAAKSAGKEASDELNGSAVRVVNDLVGWIRVDPYQPFDIHRETRLLAKLAEVPAIHSVGPSHRPHAWNARGRDLAHPGSRLRRLDVWSIRVLASLDFEGDALPIASRLARSRARGGSGRRNSCRPGLARCTSVLGDVAASVTIRVYASTRRGLPGPAWPPGRHSGAGCQGRGLGGDRAVPGPQSSSRRSPAVRT